MTLPPLNFTADEAAAVAVALTRTAQVPWATEARSALRKIVAAMPPAAAERARRMTDAVRLIVHPTPEPDAAVGREVWRAVHEGSRLRLHYTDRGGEATVREVEPFHVVLGPDGQYLTAWCHLRGDERVFRMDRITAAERAPGPRVSSRPTRVSDLPDRLVRQTAWE